CVREALLRPFTYW
nr:immunoglobulin heavy chain junction region [Mus musculus]